MVLPALAAGGARVGAGAAKIASTVTKTVASGSQKVAQGTKTAGSKMANVRTPAQIRSRLQQGRNTAQNTPTPQMNPQVGMPQMGKPIATGSPLALNQSPQKKPDQESTEDEQEEEEQQEASQRQSISSLLQTNLAQANMQSMAMQQAAAVAGGGNQSEAQMAAQKMIPRGASFLANGIAGALDLGTAGVTLILTIFTYVFSLGFLNAQMIFGKKNPMIGELSWAPIPMPIDKNANILRGLIIMADILLVIAALIFFALNALVILVWLSPALVPIFFLDYIKGLFFS